MVIINIKIITKKIFKKIKKIPIIFNIIKLKTYEQ